MYRIYVDTTDECTITPDFNDATRTFHRYIRNNPDDLVTWDRVDDPNATMLDIMEGYYDGCPVLIQQCVP